MSKKGMYTQYSGYRFDTKRLHIATNYTRPSGMTILENGYKPGFHVYCKKKDAIYVMDNYYDSSEQIKVFKFIIPKGSTVRHGNECFTRRECIVSSQLINPRED